MMRRQWVMTAAVFLLLCCVATMSALAQDLRITEMAVTTKIVRGNPIDAVSRISSTSVKSLNCFTRLENPSGGTTTIKHLWFKDDQPMGEQELKVQGTKWRTWSKRPIDKGSAGEWRVEARDSSGALLKTVKFRIN